MRAARQSFVRSLDEIEAFLDDWNPPSPWKAVVKPLDSAGTDDVFLIDSRKQARECFDIIDGKVHDRKGDDKLMSPEWDGSPFTSPPPHTIPPTSIFILLKDEL